MARGKGGGAAVPSPTVSGGGCAGARRAGGAAGKGDVGRRLVEFGGNLLGSLEAEGHGH